mmetsp:Transcript_16242/g.35809  ORF Transcript_16242/g.35809 Transcript_16242/m.35809 type:complete len:88 (-) Transcript_16242:816-1079(-)
MRVFAWGSAVQRACVAQRSDLAVTRTCITEGRRGIVLMSGAAVSLFRTVPRLRIALNGIPSRWLRSGDLRRRQTFLSRMITRVTFVV